MCGCWAVFTEIPVFPKKKVALCLCFVLFEVTVGCLDFMMGKAAHVLSKQDLVVGKGEGPASNQDALGHVFFA